MSQTIEQILTKFGVVTVMEAEFFAANVDIATSAPLFKLDTLSISNFTQEGPVKMSKGGLNAEIVFRYGKTARIEMEDVVGRIDALKHLMGVRASSGTPGTKTVTEKFVVEAGQEEFIINNPYASGLVVTVDGVTETSDFTAVADFRQVTYEGDALTAGQVVLITYTFAYNTPDAFYITDKFGGYYQIKGRTFVANAETGAREYINIIIKKFLPDSLFNLSMEAEGDLAVFNLAGEIFTDDCGIFYEFTAGNGTTCNQIAAL
jgi:hypothetical protein